MRSCAAWSYSWFASAAAARGRRARALRRLVEAAHRLVELALEPSHLLEQLLGRRAGGRARAEQDVALLGDLAPHVDDHGVRDRVADAHRIHHHAQAVEASAQRQHRWRRARRQRAAGPEDDQRRRDSHARGDADAARRARSASATDAVDHWTTGWARRFLAHAASSWPVSNGRSLPYGHGWKTRGGDPGLHQVVARGLGAPLAERLVVLDRAALVAVSLDRECARRDCSRRSRALASSAERASSRSVYGVEIEEHGLEVARRDRGRRRRASGAAPGRLRGRRGCLLRRRRRRGRRRFLCLLRATPRQGEQQRHARPGRGGGSSGIDVHGFSPRWYVVRPSSVGSSRRRGAGTMPGSSLHAPRIQTSGRAIVEVGDEQPERPCRDSMRTPDVARRVTSEGSRCSCRSRPVGLPPSDRHDIDVEPARRAGDERHADPPSGTTLASPYSSPHT